MRETLVFRVPPQLDVAVLLQRLGEVYAIQETGEETARKLYLDTFDWRLFKGGRALYRQGLQYTLARDSGEKLLHGGGSRKRYPFWWDFPEGELQSSLAPFIEVRALMPQFSVTTTSTHLGLLNTDGKTVLRLTLVNNSVQCGEHQRELQPLLLVEPLKGYKKPRRRICELLKASGLPESEGGYNIVAQIHSVFAIAPEETISKFVADLQSGQTVAQVIRDICLILRAAMLRNLPGTLDDIDSEFLHDFRVSIRRTRSLLSVMKKQLPMADIGHFQAEFKWLGTVTGPVRDLDVYLLTTKEYRDMLPEELHPGLASFFRGLARQRKRALRVLREQLKSDRVLQLLGQWEQFLRQLPERDDYPAGNQNCHEVAEKIIRKRFQRILRDGSEITPLTPDEKLHELRIEGKKFRYMLEFFRSLFNADGVDAYLRQMKKFQNNLGAFNDFSVQRAVLVQRLANMRGRSAHAVETAAALGGLIVHLGDQQRRVRSRFEGTFRGIATAENIALLENIFSDVDVMSSGEEGDTK